MELDTIVCGDCLDVMAEMPDGCVDLVVTSPPYDNLREYDGYRFNFAGIANEFYRLTKQGGVVVWVVADQTVNGSETGTSFRQALKFMEIGFNLHDTMIYEVAGTGAKGSNLAYWQSFEYMFVLTKGRPKTVNRIKDRKNKRAGTHVTRDRIRQNGEKRPTSYHVLDVGFRTNIWRYHAGNNGDQKPTNGHPAPFPFSLANDHIVSWSNPDDLVFDPMIGSGTTAVAALKLGRHFYGCDISPEYVKLANERIERTKLEMSQMELAL